MKTKQSSDNINIISLGCSKNLVDTETLMGQLSSNNIRFTFEKPAQQDDTVVINTCGFIGDAKEESINTILAQIKNKNDGLIKKVYVMGCLSERYKKELLEEIPDVDQYFGVNSLKEIVEELGGIYKKELIGERSTTTPRHYAYLKIAEGCDRTCAFCAIPLIRGKHKSRSMESIVEEAGFLAARGVKELILISQDLTYYGVDRYHKQMLPQLAEKLSEINGIEWIRLHYLYPASFPLELLEIMKTNPKINQYIDIPIQHISDTMLKRMRRKHSKEGTLSLLKTIRKELPDAAIRTTLIAGFPGETNDEYHELKKLVSDFHFDRLGIFTYSHEENTHAYQLKDDIPPAIKQERANEIMDIQQQISYQKNREKIGKSFRVIVDNLHGEFYIGRTAYDSPEVDNEVLIKAGNSHLKIGEFYQVKIIGAEDFDLFGEVI